MQRHRPGEQEGDLEIEDDEQDGDEIIAHVELHARVFEGVKAALVRRLLLRVGTARTQEAAGNETSAQQHAAEQHAADEEDQDRDVIREHALHPEGDATALPNPSPRPASGPQGISTICITGADERTRTSTDFSTTTSK